jgi:hypothetical protein
MKIADERNELARILEKSSDNIDKNVVTPGEDILELKSEPLMNVDFVDLKNKCEKEARIMVKNAISFIIPVDMIKKNKYLKDKFKVDVISLAGMIYQLRTNEIVQKSLIDQINSGMAHPRMYEVFGQLAKVIGELNKQLLQTCEALKETYKTFKQDVKEQRTEALGPSMGQNGMLTTGDGSVVTRGTKELINRVKQIKNQRNGDDYLDEAQLVPNLPLTNKD